MAMSDQQYVRLKGVKCPFCQSDEIEGHSFDVDENGAHQEISCQNCNAAWTDDYKLSGYTVTDDPDEGTQEVEPEPEIAYFIVSGRIPGDDEDTTLTLELPASSAREDATAAFTDQLYASALANRQSMIEQHGQDVYVNSVLKSDSKPVEA